MGRRTELYATCKMTGFDVYKEYIALKNHFAGNYDYHKYGGKIKANYNSYEKRPDKYIFEKLSKSKVVKDILLANFLYEDKFWIGSKEKDEVYTQWKKRQQSLTYIFKGDIIHLLPDFDANFAIPPNTHPHLFRLFLGNKICIETISILLDMTGGLKRWNTKMDDPLWKASELKIRCYLPFLIYEKKTFKKIILEKFSETKTDA